MACPWLDANLAGRFGRGSNPRIDQVPRTALLSFVLAICFSLVLVATRERRLRAPMLILGLGVIVLGTLVFVIEAESSPSGRISIIGSDREVDIATGNGRLDLWKECLTFAGERPFAGSGFGGFWSEKHTRVCRYTTCSGTIRPITKWILLVETIRLSGPPHELVRFAAPNVT